jgi:uncharacterized membrane protein YgaE (UPF0421/DUF939 family)
MGALTDPLLLATKAGAAASMAVLATQLFGLKDALSAGFVAVVCVSPTAYAGVRRGFEQVIGSVLGAGVTMALLFLLKAPQLVPLLVLSSVLFSVLLCMRLRLEQGYVVASFTSLYFASGLYASTSVALENRFGALALGIAAATFTNMVVSFLYAERILERRMRLTRAIVAKALASAPEARTVDAAFEPAFAVVSELRADLDGAARELFGRAPLGALAAAHRDEAIRLRTFLHLAKTLVLLGQPTEVLAEAIASLEKGAPLADDSVEAALRAVIAA